MLCGLGFEENWYQHGVANKALFIRMCGQRLRDQYIQHWNGISRARSGCAPYKKSEFQCSEYLKIVKCQKRRVPHTRFRTKNHALDMLKWDRVISLCLITSICVRTVVCWLVSFIV